jgi:hypothetical protein
MNFINIVPRQRTTCKLNGNKILHARWKIIKSLVIVQSTLNTHLIITKHIKNLTNIVSKSKQKYSGVAYHE